MRGGRCRRRQVCGVVKGCSGLYPKAFAEAGMKAAPVDSRVVMLATVGGQDLQAVGYKYNKRKVLFFVATWRGRIGRWHPLQSTLVRRLRQRGDTHYQVSTVLPWWRSTSRAAQGWTTTLEPAARHGP